MKTCTVCSKPLSRRAVSGFCRKHFNDRMNRDPAIRAKRSESVRNFLRANPRKAGEMASTAAAARMANPENLAKAQAAMRAVQVLSYTPEAMARRDMKARGAKVTSRRLSWCPEPYRALYTQLRRGKGLLKVDAQAIVLAQIAADRAKSKPVPKVENLSPFERQERALQNGAGIQDNVRLDRFSESATELRQKLA